MEPIIQFEHVSYAYNGEEAKKAITDVSFIIEPGEWVAIIGHNGSGKSTTARLLDGLLLPSEGNIKVGGLAVNEENIWDIRKMIGMVFQNPDNQFVGSTVEDDVAFGLENQGIEREQMVKRVHAALEKVRMQSFMDREPARLSGGQKQRVAIAGVVALEPNIIILDEATSMLDPEGRSEVIATIDELKKEKELTVISITHDIDEAARANRILVMQNGKLIKEGTPAEIFAAGEQLISLGLDVPFPEKLKATLANKEVDVPLEYLTEEGMVEWLWKLNSQA